MLNLIGADKAASTAQHLRCRQKHWNIVAIGVNIENHLAGAGWTVHKLRADAVR
jgi:hypothetical protein